MVTLNKIRVGFRKRTYQVIVDGPEAMKLESLFVMAGDALHLLVALVTHHMVDEVELPWQAEERERRTRMNIN